MRLTLADYNFVIDANEAITELIVENQTLLRKMLTGLHSQIEGCDGAFVLSEKNEVISLSKKCELITSFIPFDCNRKKLVSSLNSRMNNLAVGEFFYEKSMILISRVEELFYEITGELPGSIVCPNLNIQSIIKSLGACFESHYESVAEALIDYFDLVRYYECDKLFILYNVRSVISDNELEPFIDTLNRLGIEIIMLESSERDAVKNLKRLIIDNDLCMISV